jgi:hypothetical protein
VTRNAKIEGLDTSLHLTGFKYNMAVMVFTFAYLGFGVLVSITVKKTAPYVLAVMMFIWGLFALGQVFVTTWGDLVACRFMMGIPDLSAKKAIM